ncbi:MULTISPECIES: hypothetical protein [Streptomyces]|uniref:hypothetical protein n=1 Tax=Streptomyces TaxID=1883 RepID=UPI00163BB2AE|nr:MULTISPECIES: hypothetical protein [Streptomyces]MBC2878094.1 hypothetical protein [Streptomyces sp. TYQ1024]UBI40042.1 hypothetical protein K7I03_28645 [Streptomyces mobaraensis]UKW32622.1 hypothetical protein MCU78_28575 [Streptomyces sp. TYQ1024]
MHTAVTALGAVFSGVAALAAVMVARWQATFGRRLALESMSAQAAVERRLRLDAERCEAWKAFLRASDAFADTVWRLKEFDPRSRAEELRTKSQELTQACSGLRVLGPDAVVRHAEELRERCGHMERYAVRRAVVRSALDALKRRWCPGNAERCEERCGGNDAHGCAWLAHEMLEGWGDRDEDDRPDDLDHLEYLVRESGVLADDGAPAEGDTLTEEDLQQLLAITRNPASWGLLSAEDRWFRPRTGYDEGRSALVSSVHTFLDGTGEATTGI